VDERRACGLPGIAMLAVTQPPMPVAILTR
jgi:hypothetical protein